MVSSTRSPVNQVSQGDRSLTWRASAGFNILAVSFAVATDMLLYDVVLPVIPTALRERVHLNQGSEQRWLSILLATYGASMVIFSVLAGFIRDACHRRLAFVAGVVTLAAGTVLICVGSHLALWVVGRLCQGAAAAVVWTVGTTILADNFPELLGQALGYCSMAAMAGTALGPLLGGVLYEHAGYYAPFGLAFGMIALDFVFRILMVEPVKAADKTCRRTPVVGRERDQQEDEKTRDVGDSRLPTLASPPPVNQRARYLRLLCYPRFISLVFVYLFAAMTMTSLDSVLPLFVRDTFGWAQTGQGLIFLPLIIPRAIDPITGYLIDRWPRLRLYLAIGALFGTTPVLVCMRYVDENTLPDKILLCSLLAVLGLCMGMIETPILVELASCLPPMDETHSGGPGSTTACVFGISHGAFAAGALIGPFLGGFIRDAYGWATMTWVLALPTGFSGLLVLAGSIRERSLC